mgnify:CR=1 FL=1
MLTPIFRVSFPYVFEPRDENGKNKYSITMLFSEDTEEIGIKAVPAVKETLAELKKAVLQCAHDKWGEKLPAKWKNPLRDGTEKVRDDGTFYDGYGEGVIFCTAKTEYKPGIVDSTNKPIVDTSEFYAGCYARADVNLFAYDNPADKGGKGVSIGLTNIQKIKNGEPFRKAVAPENSFKPIKVDEPKSKITLEDL